MITEEQVIEAYRLSLRLKRRRMEIENTGEETDAQKYERLDAIADHGNLELRYEAQFVI